MSIYRLPRGQYGYSGHILNLPQDVISFVNELPRCPATLDVIIVRREGTDESHRDFRVRRAVVFRALRWLIVNNMYYNDVMINNDTLEMLPIDSHLTNLASVTLPSTEVEFSTEHDDSPYSSAHLQSTFIPASAQNFTEQETIEQSIIDQQTTRHHINWPSTAGNPINNLLQKGTLFVHFLPFLQKAKQIFWGHVNEW